jgi:hypothetical protein|tara:strand:- start:10342 stop:10806 length:465 start_codon:yes stop_codon:yes gene_type:complete
MGDRKVLDQAKQDWDQALRDSMLATQRLQKIFAAQRFFVDVVAEMEPKSSSDSEDLVKVYWLGNREPPCFFVDFGRPGGESLGHVPTGIPTSPREYHAQAYVLEAAPALFVAALEKITDHAKRVQNALADLDHFLAKLAPPTSGGSDGPEPTRR